MSNERVVSKTSQTKVNLQTPVTVVEELPTAKNALVKVLRSNVRRMPREGNNFWPSFERQINQRVAR